MKKYVIALIVTILVCVWLSWVVIVNNGTDDDLLFIIEAVLISLCVNVLSSILVAIFFEQRDRRTRTHRSRSAAHKLAAEIRHFLRTPNPTQPQVGEFYGRLAYLRDILHGDLNNNLLGELDLILTSENNDVAEIKDFLAKLEHQYGVSSPRK